MRRLLSFIGLAFGAVLISSCEKPDSHSTARPKPASTSPPVETQPSALTCYFPASCWAIESLQPISQRPALQLRRAYAGKIFVELFPDAAKQKVGHWRIVATRLSYKDSGKPYSAAYFAEGEQALPPDLQALAPAIDQYLAALRLRVVRRESHGCQEPRSFTIPIRVQ